MHDDVALHFYSNVIIRLLFVRINISIVGAFRTFILYAQ